MENCLPTIKLELKLESSKITYIQFVDDPKSKKSSVQTPDNKPKTVYFNINQFQNVITHLNCGKNYLRWNAISSCTASTHS